MKKFLIRILTFIILTYTLLMTGCGNQESSTPHEHNYDLEWINNGTKHWQQCSCGAKINEITHDFNSGEITKQPTTESKGIKTFTCLTCGYTKIEYLNKLESAPSEPQPNLKYVDITENNYEDYLKIQVYQSSQTSTCINALYRIKYVGGAERDVWGLNPDLSYATSCRLIQTKYTQTTYFNISVSPKNTSFQFSGAMVLVSYKSSFASISINKYGIGNGSFVLTETLDNLHVYNGEYYRYSLDIDNIISSIVGRVYYYD